jgi:hypothetical protein
VITTSRRGSFELLAGASALTGLETSIEFQGNVRPVALNSPIPCNFGGQQVPDARNFEVAVDNFSRCQIDFGVPQKRKRSYGISQKAGRGPADRTPQAQEPKLQNNLRPHSGKHSEFWDFIGFSFKVQTATPPTWWSPGSGYLLRFKRDAEKRRNGSGPSCISDYLNEPCRLAKELTLNSYVNLWRSIEPRIHLCVDTHTRIKTTLLASARFQFRT